MPQVHKSAQPPRTHRRLRLLSWALLLGALASLVAAWLAYQHLDRMPGELLRYAERRLYGHTKLEAVALPIIGLLRAHVERPVPPDLPTLGKGAQEHPLPPVRYENGRPVGTAPHGSPRPATRSVASAEELQYAMQAARAGDVIELLPGRYSVQRSLRTSIGGTAEAPIIVRAASPHSAAILSSVTEAFNIRHPHWNFENLLVRGICLDDNHCEHAFHVVGSARGTVLRNNRLLDFNAQIKVNGEGGQYPDDGLIQFNTLENGHPRKTTRPVTMVDLVAASNWIAADNLVANFHKAHGNGVSYGIFMKGAGSHGRIERNLVICSRQDVSARSSKPGTGVRVGISLGGGGTPATASRHGRNDAEHMHGIIASNVVAHCNDAGIDINASAQSKAIYNTLVNTSGITVRNAPASATVQGNWFDGRIIARSEGWLEASGNETRALGRFTSAPDSLHLAWKTPSLPIASGSAKPELDFCGRMRGSNTPPGALDTQGLPCL